MPAPYADLADDLTLRDRLALDRTRLANERTLLAYVRTALALLAGGLTLLHFVDAAWAAVVGGAALPLSVVVLAVGAARFRAVRQRLGGGGPRARPEKDGPPAAPPGVPRGREA